MRHDKDSILINMYNLLGAKARAPMPFKTFAVGCDYDYFIGEVIESYGGRFSRRELRSRIPFIFEYNIKERHIYRVKDNYID